MARLRAPDGCPWDREQNYDSIKPYTLEETYEVMDAIDRRDFPALAEELGDLTLQVVFYAQMAEEEGLFTVGDSLDAINEKLVRRHPHVFGTGDARTSEQVLRRWDEIKQQEKKDKGEKPKGLLDTVLKAQPALTEAAQISRKAAAAGFDWPEIDQVLDKVREELDELAEARGRQNTEDVEGEIGDLLFTLVNVARFLKVDPEQALRRTNTKFRQRFGHVERELAARGRDFSQSNLEEMEALWQEAKTNGPSNSAT
ncbi:nucleoside triphosphate pyrophosphohydrolase [uncultured Paludibaculum sp.]|uniref:nucleoside triphosphate pyrophosphohydrolase n=1 Tax=uncultured Paludibaculum sp. TaxID=1765020 RepID=UPI002AAB2035|nr:nucleoside triphosphate pyrophosphohydrolase [uncultured Paludibaculum sp.]